MSDICLLGWFDQIYEEQRLLLTWMFINQGKLRSIEVCGRTLPLSLLLLNLAIEMMTIMVRNDPAMELQLKINLHYMQTMQYIFWWIRCFQWEHYLRL